MAPTPWEIEAIIQEALRNQPAPDGGPHNRQFVLDEGCSQVLQWVHSSKFSCHPGITPTLSLLKYHFSMDQDTREYVRSSTICSRGKPSNTPPSGLLQPLPVPGRPWSHIALDFVTGLPPSHGNSVIFTIVDHFPKVIHFIALPKLPSAMETADLITHHVLRLHGIPYDIVSDQGPQLTSQV